LEHKENIPQNTMIYAGKCKITLNKFNNTSLWDWLRSLAAKHDFREAAFGITSLAVVSIGWAWRKPGDSSSPSRFLGGLTFVNEDSHSGRL